MTFQGCKYSQILILAFRGHATSVVESVHLLQGVTESWNLLVGLQSVPPFLI